MNTVTVSPIHSARMQSLHELFNALQKPYGHAEIIRFNQTYQRLYPTLSRAEKLRAEKFVDGMLDNLKDERLASKIYGVV